MQVEKQKNKWKRQAMIDVVMTALILIIVGFLFVGRNLGYLEPYIFNILISWQMLLIVLGIWSISHKGYKWGILMTGVGAFFLIPVVLGLGSGWIGTYWPLILVFIGILILIYLLLPKRWTHRATGYNVTTDYRSEDGFISSENNFGSLQQIVLDEVFRGGNIKSHFGATELDLRRSTLEPGDTYLDIDCSFCGIELFIPENWVVLTEVQPFLSGIDDKRFRPSIESEGRLIIRGKMSFSGLEIKN